MEVILIICLLLLLVGILFLVIRFSKWILRSKMRLGVFLILLGVGIVGQGIHHLFFKNMQFIQSEVYPDLYLIKYPDKDQKVVHQAIREKVIKHLANGFLQGKKLAYQREDSIFFYTYYKTFPLSIFQDAGTEYFLENEEDLGGLVTEELGMYRQYKLAEFYYAPCKADETLYCGEISYFNKGNFVKSENLFNLVTSSNVAKEVNAKVVNPALDDATRRDVSIQYKGE